MKEHDLSDGMDCRPMRRVQFFNNVRTVVDMDYCKNLITFTDQKEPLSVYGRWDLGFGTTELKFVIDGKLVFRTRPDGSLDAKAFCASEMRNLLDNLKYTPCPHSAKTSFWMKYGTAHIQGEPFVWSQSRFAQFKSPQSEDFVPDAVDGNWNLIHLHMD